MVWIPLRACVASLMAGWILGCVGCEPAKKTDNSRKEIPSKEATSAETSPKHEEQAAAEQREKVPANSDPVEPSTKPTAESSPKMSEATPAPSVPEATTEKPANVAKTKKRELPPPAAIPKVSLSDKLRSTCRVNVGEELPQSELADLDGKPVALSTLYGDALTVVCFWNVGTTPYARGSAVGMLGDMQADISEPFSAKGLKVVGIDVGDTPDNVKDILQKSRSGFPNLFDPKGDYFKTVATERLPRVYLLDGSGKILWFDVEYGRATRRELLTAVRAVLEGKK